MLQSLDRGLAIMKYLSSRNNVSVSEIASAFHITKSTASRIMSTLANHDMASRNEANKKYHLGIGTLIFSSQMFNENPVLELCRPVMRQLMEATGKMVHLSAWVDNQPYMLDQMRSKKQAGFRYSVVPGMITPVHCSATGKVLLAYLEEEQRQSVIEQLDLAPFSEKTITDPQKLTEECAAVRSRGWALEREEVQEKVFSLAIPVLDTRGQIRFSLGLMGNKDFSRSDDRLDFYCHILRLYGEKLQECTDKQ